jgi:hypothetical protein
MFDLKVVFERLSLLKGLVSRDSSSHAISVHVQTLHDRFFTREEIQVSHMDSLKHAGRRTVGYMWQL